MGKLRRERKKYHLASVKPSAQSDTSCVDPAANSPTSNQTFSIPDNVFAGLDISYDDLKRSLKDPDVISVKSNKTTTGNALSKKEKRKQRHEVFLKKLEATYEARKEKKKHKKKQKMAPKSDPQPLSDKLPSLRINLEKSDCTTKKERLVKKRGIQKAKQRKKKMLQDIKLFQSLLEKQEYKLDPVQSISRHIQSKVLEEVNN